MNPVQKFERFLPTASFWHSPRLMSTNLPYLAFILGKQPHTRGKEKLLFHCAINGNIGLWARLAKPVILCTEGLYKHYWSLFANFIALTISYPCSFEIAVLISSVRTRSVSVWMIYMYLPPPSDHQLIQEIAGRCFKLI